MALELFTNNPSTTVPSGGTDAPAAGTQETWTVTSSAPFPAASSSATPPTQFHVADPQAPTELITVVNVSGTTWTVVRGAENTTPVAHTAGFTVQQVVTAGVFGGFYQNGAGGPLTVNGNFTAQGTVTAKAVIAGGVPTVAAGAAAGTGATVTGLAGTDLGGSFTLTAGTSPAAGTCAAITFGTTLPAAPAAVILQVVNTTTGALVTTTYPTSLAATGFSAATSAALTASDAYLVSWVAAAS